MSTTFLLFFLFKEPKNKERRQKKEVVVIEPYRTEQVNYLSPTISVTAYSKRYRIIDTDYWHVIDDNGGTGYKSRAAAQRIIAK